MERHGKVTSFWDGDLFTVITEGPFNMEGIEYGASQLKEAVLNRSHKSWRRLEVWDNESLSSPEAIKIGMALWEWMEKNGCIRNAVVISNGVHASILKEYLNEQSEAFTNLEDAKHWLTYVPTEILHLKKSS